MKLTWEYIAGFFDGEGSVSTMNFTYRDTLAATIVTLSQSGDEGMVILTAIQKFLAAHGIKAYLQKAQTKGRYRPMRNLRICARPSVRAFLWQMLSRVSVKRVVVQDTLRFITVFPSVKGATTAIRNQERGKYGAVHIDVDKLKAEYASGLTMKKLAAKYNCNTYTIHKYLDPDYRKRYDAYRKKWRENQIAKAKAASAA